MAAGKCTGVKTFSMFPSLAYWLRTPNSVDVLVIRISLQNLPVTWVSGSQTRFREPYVAPSTLCAVLSSLSLKPLMFCLADFVLL